MFFKKKWFLFVFFYFLLFHQLIGQTNVKMESKVADFKNNYSNYFTNDELINGSIYLFPDKKINGNPFLYDLWQNADIFIHGKTYPNVYMNYDIVNNDVIIQIPSTNGIKKIIDVNDFQVDSFLVGNTVFVNTLTLNKHINVNKNLFYVERITKGKYPIFKKYTKELRRNYNSANNPYGKFSELKEDLLMLTNNNLIEVNRKSEFLECFSKSNRKEIKQFLKKNNIKFRNSSSSELIILMEYCQSKISN